MYIEVIFQIKMPQGVNENLKYEKLNINFSVLIVEKLGEDRRHFFYEV